MQNAYSALVELRKEIALLGSTSATLSWDQETQLNSRAINYRAEQLAYLSGKSHQLATSNVYAKCLAQAEQEAPEEIHKSANLREWRHHFDRTTKLPQELVERSSKTSSIAKSVWAEARNKGDFSLFAPQLEELLAIAKEKAELWGYSDEPYDALLGNYERAANTRDVVAIFNQFEAPLTKLAREAVALNKNKPARKLTGDFPIAAQQTLNREVAESIGFDFKAGRIDTTTHPFCTTLGPEDVRLTTRYYSHDFTASLFGVMHEAGHGLYEQGLPSEYYGQPSGSAVSLGIHESQSLLWEAHVGRSHSFWNHWLPRAQELFPQLADWTLDEFLHTINQAKYSFIRVDADEATYDLHILLRFDIERRLLNGEIGVNDIPAVWNAKFRDMFDMLPENDSAGCLQDIHWAMGGLGYFPTYTLGNLNASQLYHTASQIPLIKEACSRADYAPLLQWMREKIHQHGSTYHPQDLMLRATSETTNPNYHLEHLKRRFIDKKH